MVTINTNTIGTTGRDFTTMTAWEAARQGDLVADDRFEIGEVYNDSTFDEGIVIDGSVTDATRFLKLTVAEGERHNGTPGTGARIVRTGSTGSIVRVVDPACVVEWLAVDGNGDNHGIIFGLNAPLTLEAAFDKCLAYNVVTTSAKDTIGFRLASNTGIIKNCMAFNLKQTDSGSKVCIGFEKTTVGPGKVLNCTAHGIVNDNGTGGAFCFNLNDISGDLYQNLIGTDPSGTTSGAKDCYVPASPANATVDHNLSSDTTASGTGSLTSKASADQFVSTTIGSEDLHLKAVADALDAGVDLSPDVIDDIDGQSRPSGAAYDMGADELAAVTRRIFVVT